ncbi:MAG: hypothetical protein HYX93_03980, partial [Chloroflexi bacterium]|nr:hypothetical protein [Chloroflexota bacterium]
MDNDGLDLRAYSQVLLKWWWLFLLGVVGAATAAFFVSSALTPIYQAKTVVSQVYPEQSRREPCQRTIHAAHALRQALRVSG